MYGTTIVGTKGQVVIPVQARRDLKIRPGDTLLVVGKFGRVLGFIKSDQLARLVDFFLSHIEGSDVRGFTRDLKKQADKILQSMQKG